MIMDWTRTNYLESGELPVISTTTTTIEEGTPLEYATQTTNTTTVVQASAGSSANAYFVGVAMHQYSIPTYMVQVDSFTIPSSAPYTVTLTYTANAPSTDSSAISSTTGYLTYNSGVGSGQYKIVTATATFNVAQAGQTVNITYQYALTVAQARALVGDGVVGSSAEQVLNSVGVIKIGNIYTTLFDLSQNWTAANITGIVAVANGIFSLTGTGSAVTGAVISQPTGDYPYLGLYINH